MSVAPVRPAAAQVVAAGAFGRPGRFTAHLSNLGLSALGIDLYPA